MKKKLVETLTKNLTEIDSENASVIIDNFCIITEPEIESLNNDFSVIGLVIVDPQFGGKSVKPGNVFFNLKKLLIDSAEATLTIAGVIAQPYLTPLAALILWNKYYSNVKIDLEEKHAATIKIMWENRDQERNWINEKMAFKLYNNYRRHHNQNEMILEDFEMILKDLKNMGCIKKINKVDWWLIEGVKIEYD